VLSYGLSTVSLTVAAGLALVSAGLLRLPAAGRGEGAG